MLDLNNIPKTKDTVGVKLPRKSTDERPHERGTVW
jgi:hypothetical protein